MPQTTMLPIKLLWLSLLGIFLKSASADSVEDTAYTIGVYYYPWHGDDFHRGQGYVRRELHPPQLPALGEYDDTDPVVIQQHLQWSQGANINLWVLSWWGPESREDRTARDKIMTHSDLPGTRIALFYETSRLMKANYAATTYSDVEYMAKTYFNNANYMRIDDRPVLFVYLTRLLSERGTLEEITTLMRQAAMENGEYDLYIMGDQVFGDAPGNGKEYEPFTLLDGVTNYDVYGNLNRPDGYVGLEGFNDLVSRTTQWQEETQAHGDCAFVPCVAPGYNDRGVRFDKGHPALSRKLYEGAPEGSLFQASLEKALELTEESTGRMLMINSWNEWHEDSQIEPVGDGIGETDQPLNMTCYGEKCDKSLNYEAYGEKYLDILRNVISESTKKKIIPLKQVGNNGSPPDRFPLGRCQGDCDRDDECQDGLLCMQRNNFEAVPGCTGGESVKKTDFCYGRPHDHYLWLTGNNGVPAQAFPLSACDGDCDNDADCFVGLKCFQRRRNEAVPGCEGRGGKGKDYCFDPNSM